MGIFQIETRKPRAAGASCVDGRFCTAILWTQLQAEASGTQMPGLELEAADGGGRIPLPAGETLIGRGPFLGIADKRVSRNHGVLEVVGEKLRIKPVHVNPCFYQPSHKKQFLPLEKDKWQWLGEGDRFSLLPDTFVFKVVSTQSDMDSTLSNSQNIDDEVEGKALESTSEVHEASKVAEERSRSTSDTVGKAQLPSSNRNERMQQTKPIQRKRDLPAWMLQEGLDVRPLSASPAKTVVRRRKCKVEQKAPEECPQARKRLSPSEDSVRNEECEKEHQKRSRIKTEQKGHGAVLKEAPALRVSKDTDNLEIGNKNTELQRTRSPTKDEICQPKSESLEHNQTPNPQLPTQIHRRKWSVSERQESLDKSPPAPHRELSQSPVHPTADQETDASCSPTGQIGGSVRNEDTSQGSTQTSSKRMPCVYGQQCYRKNPAHFQQFSHPGDSDFHDASKESQEDNDERPECPYGTDCYRKNPQHKLEYKHTKSPERESERPKRKTAKKGKSVLGDESDDDGEPNAYDLEDSFIDDDEEEEEHEPTDEDSDYEPDSEERDIEDMGTLLKEANTFVKTRK